MWLPAHPDWRLAGARTGGWGALPASGSQGFAQQLRTGSRTRASGHSCHPVTRVCAERALPRLGPPCACLQRTRTRSDQRGARLQGCAARTRGGVDSARRTPPPGQDSFGGGVPSPPACTRSPAQGAAPGGSRPAGPVPGGSTRSNLLSFLILGRGWRGPGSEPLRVLAPAALRAALPPPPAPPPTPSGRGAECWVLDAGCSRVPAESQPSCTRPGKLGARNSSGTRRCKE